MELLGAVFCAPLYITYFEFFHRAVQTVYVLIFFMLPLSALAKLRPMIVDLSIFFFLHSLTFGFTYFEALSLATQNFKIVLYTYPGIIKKIHVFPCN